MSVQRTQIPWIVLVLMLGLLGCEGRGKQSEPEHSEAAAEREASPRAEHGHGEEAVPKDDHGHEGEQTAGVEEEGRVVLTQEAIEASGIVVDITRSHEIARTIDLPGEVVTNADRLAHIVPRFPGIAKEVHKDLGDVAQQGEVLAVIESNESLAPYEVTSLISGTIIEKHITLGEFVRDDADIYVVADLSTVWVNVTVYTRDIEKVRRGQVVRVIGVGGSPEALGTIDYIGPVIGEITRAATARVVLPNGGRTWRPGLFVTARIQMERTTVRVGVPDDAIQQVEGENVVFVEDDGGFVTREVRLGRSDGKWTEVISGLDPGERYAAAGSFILKSELMKSEAGHEH